MNIPALFTSISSTLDILSGIETNAVLAERVSLLKDQVEILRNTCEATQKELTQLKEKCRLQDEELSRYRATEQFIFEFGAAFKKSPSGYIKAVYCPNCLTVASSSFSTFPFQCSTCKWRSMFKIGEFERIFKSLP